MPDAVPEVPPRPAATVMLVRDASEGVEVFLMKRSGFGSFGGLHVFPGGKVDDSDRAGRWNALTTGPEDAAASQVLGVPRGGLGYWVACIRECFEEAGVLLASDPGGRTIPFADPAVRRRFEDWRVRLNAGEGDLLERMCRDENLLLAADQLAYVSHWITPLGQPARFNTRFFVARAPSEQDALHDGHETVESEWLRPVDALERFADGDLNLISPTEKNLEAIAGFSSTEALLEAKRAVDPSTIPTILPAMRERPNGQYDETLEVVGYGGQSSDT